MASNEGWCTDEYVANVICTRAEHLLPGTAPLRTKINFFDYKFVLDLIIFLSIKYSTGRHNYINVLRHAQ